MVKTAFMGDVFMVQDNAHGTSIVRLGGDVVAFYKHADPRGEQLHAEIDALREVWTDYEAPGGPKVDAAEFRRTVEEHLTELVSS